MLKPKVGYTTSSFYLAYLTISKICAYDLAGVRLWSSQVEGRTYQIIKQIYIYIYHETNHTVKGIYIGCSYTTPPGPRNRGASFAPRGNLDARLPVDWYLCFHSKVKDMGVSKNRGKTKMDGL